MATKRARWWSFVPRSWLDEKQEACDRLALENYTLRDALREANAELVRHRATLAALCAKAERR